jgi:uncharacterized membrane protein (DUF106 family)
MFESLVQLMKDNPRISLILVGMGITLVSTLVTKHFTDQEHLKSLKKRQKELQAEIKKHHDNPTMLEALNKEMLEGTAVMMKSNFKPMLITFIPFLLLFYWLSANFSSLIPGKWLFPAWVWYYLVSSIVFGIIFRKIFKMA